MISITIPLYEPEEFVTDIELFVDTQDAVLAGNAARDLRDWISAKDPNISLRLDRADGQAMDVEGSILVVLSLHLLGHVAYDLIRLGLTTVATKYGVEFKAKTSDGQEGRAQELLPR